MRVFVAGASGAIGRRLVPQLVRDGHEVTAVTRRPDRARELETLGARPVVADVFDAAALERAVREAAPDAVVHQLTDLPHKLNPRRLKKHYAANNRVRREGTANLLAAARAAGAKRFVLQSAAYWYAPDDARRPATEEVPLWVDAPGPIGPAVQTMVAAEEAVAESGLEPVILRYGMFYGPGTWYGPEGQVTEQVRSRMYPIVGSGDGEFSFVHVDDAAAATVAALTGPPGTYNVADDEPAPMHAWVPAYADALGAKPPRRAPRGLAVLAAGRAPVTWMERLRGADNGRAKAELGWRPQFATWREGFRATLRKG